MDKFKQHDQEFWKAVEIIFESSEIVIDRPKGTTHPRYPDITLPVDYGYIKNTRSPDGGGIDIWVGSKKIKIIDSILCTVDPLKKDSEIKILYGCDDNEKVLIYDMHNGTCMKAVMIER
jgi:inorganic pyrophosphatase